MVMRLVLGNRLSVFKCRVAASISGIILKTEKAPRSNDVRLPLLHNEGFSVFGEHAICQYFMDTFDRKTNRAKIADWLEIDAKNDNHLLFEKLGNVSEGQYLVNNALTSADICVGCSLFLAKHNGDTIPGHASVWLDSLLARHHHEFHAAWKATETDMAENINPLDFATEQGAILSNIMREIGAMVLDGVDSPFVGEGNRKQGTGVPPDFQLNNGVSSFRKLENSTMANPRAYAVHLESKIKELSSVYPSIIERTDIGGPGFINLYLNEGFVAKRVEAILKDKKLKPYRCVSKKVGVDFSSPNIAKEMHVGHLRSTIIGEVICRCLEFLGHDVDRINHVGDWGTQFGMLLVYMRHNHPDHLENPPTISDLNEFYQAAKKAFDASDDFKQESRLEVVKLQSGDVGALAAWQQFVDISFDMCNAVYDRLDVSFPNGHCGESFYNSRIPATVTALEEKGLVEINDGAKCIFTKAFQVPLFIVKRDGGYGYDSTDMTAIKYRVQELDHQWIVYVTDSGQELHFRACFEAAERAGWTEGVRLDHVGFGVVQGKDRKRFKTRDGGVVRLVDLLDEAKQRMWVDLKQRKADGRTPLEDNELEAAAADIGYSAIKYADLKNSREKDYVFDYDMMLQSDGDTAVYLIYSYARVCGILRKIEATGLNIETTVEEQRPHFVVSRERPLEWDLAMKLISFPDKLHVSVEELRPHHLCGYCYELANAMAKFYAQHQLLVKSGETGRMIDPVHGKNWLVLLSAVKIALHDALILIGIKPLERI